MELTIQNTTFITNLLIIKTMRKKMFFLSAAFLMSLASWADSWVKPTISDEMFANEFSTSSEAVGDTTIYYLYNTEGEGFFNSGKAPAHSKWESNAILSDQGARMFFFKYITKNPETGENQEWDGKTYILKNEYKTAGTWKEVFSDTQNNINCDRRAQADYLWEIIPQGSGVYYIKLADANPNWNNTAYAALDYYGNTEFYMGFNEYDEDYLTNGVKSLSPALANAQNDENEPHLAWRFVPEANYQAYLQRIQAYEAAQNMAQLIEQAKEEYPELNMASYEAIYANTSSTAETINEAIETLKKEMRDAEKFHVLHDATEDDPRDATILLVNPAFENDGNYVEKSENVPGWVHTVQTYNNNRTSTAGHIYTADGKVNALPENYEGAYLYHFLEIWRRAADVDAANDAYPFGEEGGQMYQTIEDLPSGKYEFTCDAIACCQINDTGTGFYKNPVENVYLYALGGSIETRQKISTAVNIPERFKITFVHDGGDIQLGVRFDHTCATWVCLDNFTLTYYGPISGDPEKVSLWAAINDAKATFSDLDQIPANTTIKQDFEELLNEASTATENFQKYREDIAEGKSNLQKSINEYKTFKSYIDECYGVLEQYDDDARFTDFLGELSDMYSEWLEAYEQGTYTGEDIAAIKGVVMQRLIDFKVTLVEVGELTDLLVFNPYFDYAKGINGWNVTNVTKEDLNNGTGQGRNILHLDDMGDKGENGTYYSNVLKEMDKTFEISQSLPNMPAGCYTLTLNAFERTGDIDNAFTLFDSAGGKGSGDNAGTVAYIYLNDEKTTFNNIWAGAQPEMIWATDKGQEDGVTITNQDATRDYYEGMYIPDATTSANFYFNLCNAYLNSVSIYLPEPGTLQLGIKKDVAQNSFMVMDNMRLYYHGNDLSAFASVIDEMLDKLEKVLPADASYGVDAAEKVELSSDQLKAAKSNSIESCIEALNNAKETIAYAQGSIKAYKHIQDNLQSLYDNTAWADPDIVTPSIYKRAEETLEKAENVLESGELNNEEAEALAQEMELLTGLVTVENFENASPENPADFSSMIVNGTFDVIGDFNGWKGTAFGAGGETSTCAEMYNKNFDAYQDIKGLPGGNYIVMVDGFYRRGEIANENEIDFTDSQAGLNVTFYAVTPADSVTTLIPSISTGAVAANEAPAANNVQANNGVVPNSMAAAVAWIEAGHYTGNQLAVSIEEGEVLRIGVKKTQGYTNDWALFDNFQLYYLGNKADHISGTALDARPAFRGIYNLMGQRISAPQRGINIIRGKKYVVK